MTAQTDSRRACRGWPVAGLAGVACLLAAAPAAAVTFSAGEVTGSLDTTITAGASMRVEKRNTDNVGKANLYPPEPANPLTAEPVANSGPGNPDWELWAFGPGSFGINGDDGNLNYDEGDLISAVVEVSHELSLKWRNYGAFFRGSYFYDFVNTNFEEDPRTALSVSGSRARPDSIESQVGRRVRLLDAYVYGDFQVLDRYLSARLGNQVVNWGESTFIQFGVNRVNPFDLPAFRKPGAEVEDVLIPVPMVWASMDLTMNLSLEGFYQFEWEHTRVDPRGTYFSTTDLAGDGATHAVLGFARQRDVDASLTPRIGDREPEDAGQFGGALRWFVPEWNATEFGFYAMRYNSRLPVVSFNAADPVAGTSTGQYFLEYPEDLHTFGASMNTLTPIGVSIGAEVSYTLDQPMQLDGEELTFANLSALERIGAFPPGYFDNMILGSGSPSEPGRSAQFGEYLAGYRRLDYAQAQATGIYQFGAQNLFNASSWTLVAEVGASHVPDLPNQDTLRFETPDTPMPGGDQTDNQLNGAIAPNPLSTPNDDFAEDFGWGYRILSRWEYNNFLGTAWGFEPSLFFSHDVSGTLPGPANNFIEGRKSASFTLGFNYLERWTVELGYSAFFGAGEANALRDRDFVSANVKYAF